MNNLSLFASRQLNLARLVVGFIIFMLANTACTPMMNPPNNPGPTKIILAVTETKPVMVQTFTPLQSKVATRNFIPTPVSPTTIFITWTPLATLSNSQATNRMVEWFLGTPGCRFPCWAGITLGKTTWMEAKQIIGAVVNVDALDENITCTFGPCNNIAWHSKAGLDIHGDISSNSDGFINWITIESYQPIYEYRLDKMLKQYGSPDKVFLQTEFHSLNNYDVFFALTLAYPQYQFIIKYTWMATISGENVIGCLQNGDVYLSLKQIKGEWTDDLIKHEIYSSGDIGAVVFRPLQEVTDMTINDFYKKFTSVSGSECITTPGKFWP